MSLRINSLPLLRTGTTFVARFWHYEQDAMLFLRALTTNAQANIRSGKTRNDTRSTTTNVMGGNVFPGKIVRFELPESGDVTDPFTFIDCTSGQIAVDVVCNSPFVTQLQG